MEIPTDPERRRRELLTELLRTRWARRPRPHEPGARRGGMRQQDVARHARISVRRYAALEQGKFTPDAGLLDRVAVALTMTPTERSSLWLLAAGHEPPQPAGCPGEVPARHGDAVLREIVTALHPVPAAVLDETWTARFWNPALDEWSAGWFSAQPDPPNLVCWLFSGQARDLLPGIAALRRSAAAGLRYQLARNISAPGWRAIQRCLTATPDGAAVWARHELDFPVNEQSCQYTRPRGETGEARMLLTPVHQDVWLYALIPQTPPAPAYHQPCRPAPLSAGPGPRRAP